MTCRGYDPKAVKLGKVTKTISATIANNDMRKGFLRSYTKIAEEESRQKGSRRDSK